jgi:Holliday junction DNA helicase RuvB
MHTQYDGGPVGIDTLAATLNEDRDTIEDVYEPYLVYRGFIARTPRGRTLTEQAIRYLKNQANAENPV